MRIQYLLPLLLLLSPGAVSALALGSMEVSSKLNQRLNARIELRAANNEALEDVTATLADQAAFDRAGLERPFILTSLRFEIVTAGGSSFILVSSRETIREPLLNFIVEVAAPAGRILRNYTVLLTAGAADLDRY